MSRLIVIEFVSLDGLMHDPDGSDGSPQGGWKLPRLGFPGPTPESQGTQDKGTEKHDNADEQQIQQALDDDTYDAEHDRHDHEE